MKKFDKLKSEFIELLRDKSPCSSEYKRVLNSTTQEELLKVIFENTHWCLERKVFTQAFLDRFDPKILLASGLAQSGKDNSGIANSGDRNSGSWNSGSWNSGDRNSGDSNSGYRNSGAFCTDPNPYIYLFDAQTNIRVRDWENHEACRIMNNLNPNIWVWSSEMNAEEKIKYPTHETTGGFLKSIPYKEAWANMWGNLTDEKKKVFTSLPNFNSEKFFEITGIKA